MRALISFLLILLTSAACTSGGKRVTTASTTPITSPVPRDPCKFAAPQTYAPTPEQRELDDIFMLLAYSVVFKNWQGTIARDESRGYNIGSVLVDGSNNVVCWAVNSVFAAGNSTHHGEVRLITNYLENTPQARLSEYSIYTTLEPCAMCAGMMTMQSIIKAIHGQRDPDYGEALQRLALDSTAMNGYCPYPRAVVSAEATNDYARALDGAYGRYYASTATPRIVRWLTTPEASAIFRSASAAFQEYQVTYPRNQRHLDAAREFLKTVPTTYLAIPYASNCPGRGEGRSEIEARD